MAAERVERRVTFEQSAERYDAARPGYPEELFDDIAALTALPASAGGRALEIGCGTGKATLPLARRGYRITGVELGPGLAAVARRRLAAYPQVEIIVANFEEWPLPAEPFDLVTSATAFHWLDPALAYPKVARALRPEGALAIFRHHHVWSAGSAPFFERMQRVYRAVAPEMAARFRLLGPEAFPAAEEPNTRSEIERSGLFGPVTTSRYVWEQEYDAAGYLNLLSTYSDHLRLDPETRGRLFAGIADLIDTEFGGRIVKRYLVVLHVARKA